MTRSTMALFLATLVTGCLFPSTFLAGCKNHKSASEQKESEVGLSNSVHTIRDERWQRERICDLKIKSQTQTKYPYRFGRPTERGFCSFIARFDTLGRVSEIGEFENNMGDDQIYRFFYDKKGEMYQEKAYSRSYGLPYATPPSATREDRVGGLLGVFARSEKRDSSGVLLERNTSAAGSSVKEVFGYDKAGDCISEVTYDPWGRVIYKVAFMYDGTGRIVKSIDEEYTEHAWSNDIAGPRTNAEESTYAYDDKQNVIERIDYENGDPIFAIRYTYTYYK